MTDQPEELEESASLDIRKQFEARQDARNNLEQAINDLEASGDNDLAELAKELVGYLDERDMAEAQFDPMKNPSTLTAEDVQRLETA